MSLNQDFVDLFACLNQEKAEYLIVDAYAVIFYTEPRYTKDIDLWIKSDPENAKKVYAALKNFGAPIDELKVQDLSNPQMIYQIGIEPNRIDILMDLTGLDFETAWKNKNKTEYGKEKIYLLSLEDLIRAKQALNRLQDQIDLEKLRKVPHVK